jgi:hypothetical protein
VSSVSAFVSTNTGSGAATAVVTVFLTNEISGNPTKTRSLYPVCKKPRFAVGKTCTKNSDPFDGPRSSRLDKVCLVVDPLQ